MAKKTTRPTTRTTRRANPAATADDHLPPLNDAPPAAQSPLPEIEGRDDSAIRILTLPVTSEGRVNWEKVKGKKRARLRSIINDPDFSREVGLNVEPGAASFDANTAATFYAGISMLLSGALQLRGVAPEHARLAGFRQDQVAQLAPLTAKVLNKYVGTFPYADEVTLALALGMVVSSNMAEMRDAINATHKQQPLPLRQPAGDAAS